MKTKYLNCKWLPCLRRFRTFQERRKTRGLIADLPDLIEEHGDAVRKLRPRAHRVSEKTGHLADPWDDKVCSLWRNPWFHREWVKRNCS